MNLTTEIGRKEAIEAIEQSFIQSLRDIGVELSDNVYCKVGYERLDLFSDNLCQISLHSSSEEGIYKNGISISNRDIVYFGINDKVPIDKIMTSASILKNWDKVCEAVNKHCKRYSELVKKIQKKNP